MFSRIQVRGYRCLKGIDQPLSRFQAMVGPNASGKTTLLDVVLLLGDLMRSRGEVREVVGRRSADFSRLLWKGEGSSFQIAVEAPIPESVRERMTQDKQRYSIARYEIEIGFDAEANTIGLDHETLWLITPPKTARQVQRRLFPETRRDSGSIFLGRGTGKRVAINKKPGGNDNFYTEGAKSYMPSFRLGRTRSALANVPADPVSFPVSLWFREMLENSVQDVSLDSHVMRQPSPPGLGRRFQSDGSNLPWVVHDLSQDKKPFSRWVDHVRTALEDVQEIETVERPEDKHRYLVVKYANGASVPSWLLSDGTLRLLALTIPAYLKDMRGVYLIEEPENGIHPRAIETVVQSLTSIYQGQVLLATHSPVVLNQLGLNDILCFAKDDQGATDIVSGDRHPRLTEWKQGQPDLGVLFASGILS